MSRIAKSPVELPKGVEFKQSGNVVTLKGGKGELSMELSSEVELKSEDGTLTLAPALRISFRDGCYRHDAFTVSQYGPRCN